MLLILDLSIYISLTFLTDFFVPVLSIFVISLTISDITLLNNS